MKDEILRLLKENTKDFISGQEISERFGVSRTAIWKYMNQLKIEGYEIESVSKKGYRLLDSPDILTYEEIYDGLSTKFIGRKIIHFDSIDSTNSKAKELASLLDEDGTVVIAEEQTMGKGRLGRNFISPNRKGIWMSIILKPDINPLKVSMVTQIGAAAINKAFREMKIETLIKWPNDILLNKKKLCGILTEMSAELTKVNFIVMGIGINVNLDKDDFTEEVRETATSAKIEIGKRISRKEIVARILNNFEPLYKAFVEKEDIEETIAICRENSILIDREIRVIKRENSIRAKVLDINNKGELIVKYEDGKVENLISGEISIRGLESYI
ncbi:biotin--[acetyl-CoA-carboxylase] ligase [Clostridium pasteurianum]|uniref:Bifunctional ligase/repressor BirA n=1 Tax=Clostridium pasteurianum BC1 TaxID=86416 RepID=R4K204_CLOPA|nr:biotin--[acetyl-CoA-carboxylase] ligase [Clostridium pasteurianum]AGK96593.1 birA, biotin-(acetyl-CoA-carboxylase) ligase [Clostridium pasteurianum BC1]